MYKCSYHVFIFEKYKLCIHERMHVSVVHIIYLDITGYMLPLRGKNRLFVGGVAERAGIRKPFVHSFYFFKKCWAHKKLIFYLLKKFFKAPDTDLWPP